jgi:kinase suppressor of Ras 2
VAIFKQTIQQNQSLSSGPHQNADLMSPASVKSDGYRSNRTKEQRHHRTATDGGENNPTIAITPFGGADSSSNTSSCTSSSPSSPALIGNSGGSTSMTPNSASRSQAFAFPDVAVGHHAHARPQNVASELIDTCKSNDSDRTMSVASGSTDSQRTLACRIDSQDSQVSVDDDRNWPRQNSLTSKEWEIPFDELKIDDVIGTGRFGTVFRGQWHGAVAVKQLNMNAGIDIRRALEAFRQEVAMFRKTRHDNLILFMGACMKPPQLAIVTSLCKGSTLYTHLHHMKTKFPPSRALVIAQQICQGMSYLHARDIIHKDLKTKNVFLENGKVVITDFGLFSVTKLCQGNRSVPRSDVFLHCVLCMLLILSF